MLQKEFWSQPGDRKKPVPAKIESRKNLFSDFFRKTKDYMFRNDFYDEISCGNNFSTNFYYKNDASSKKKL